jgi:uncharacterized protein YggU (UPF0235/DUF167 family)
MYVRVSVYPSAKKEIVLKVGENRYEIRVKEPAERNLANTRVIELLANLHKVTPKSIRIVSGHHSGRKIFSLPEEE